MKLVSWVIKYPSMPSQIMMPSNEFIQYTSIYNILTLVVFISAKEDSRIRDGFRVSLESISFGCERRALMMLAWTKGKDNAKQRELLLFMKDHSSSAADSSFSSYVNKYSCYRSTFIGEVEDSCRRESHLPVTANLIRKYNLFTDTLETKLGNNWYRNQQYSYS